MIDVNKMYQHTSSLLYSRNATMQRCMNNSHEKGQLSNTLDIPQLRTNPRADGHGLHTVNGKVGGILDRQFLHASRPGLNSGGAAPKGHPELENHLDGFRFEDDIYMSKLDIQCHSK